jgi:hypothetical protein
MEAAQISVFMAFVPLTRSIDGAGVAPVRWRTRNAITLQCASPEECSRAR